MELHPDPAHRLSENLYDLIPLLCVQWKTPDDGQRNCPKHVEFHYKNKFEKLVHLVRIFIIRNLTQCMITWTSNKYGKWNCPDIVSLHLTFCMIILFEKEDDYTECSIIRSSRQNCHVLYCKRVVKVLKVALVIVS